MGNTGLYLVQNCWGHTGIRITEVRGAEGPMYYVSLSLLLMFLYKITRARLHACVHLIWRPPVIIKFVYVNNTIKKENFW
jgi:hypothetical protein